VSDVCEKWFDKFVAEGRAELTGFLCRILRSSDDAAEVSQEAYLKVYLALRQDTAREHCPKALLYTTARNLAISRLRHQKVIDRSALAVTVNQELQTERRSPEQFASSSEDLRDLLLVVNRLPPKCRKVLLLRMLEGLSQKEIAARLDIAVSTVEKHLAKALHSSRNAMADLKQSRTQGADLPLPVTSAR
jgi:RNA polymerase sigma factor (sigma-70 family)